MNPAPNPYTDLLISIVQKGLTVLGTWLVTQGLIDQSNATALLGLAPVLVGIGWGLWTRYRSSKVAVAAHNAGVNVPDAKAAPIQAVKTA